jgi:tetratricopeptide (TPR) repeat protein
MGNEELRTFVSEARRLRAQESWGKAAIEANTRILVLDPTNVAALNRRARCYRERMDLSAAKEDYLRALELSPGNENIEKALLEIEEKFREGRDYEKRVDEIRSIRDSAEACAIGRAYKNKSPARHRRGVQAGLPARQKQDRCANRARRYPPQPTAKGRGGEDLRLDPAPRTELRGKGRARGPLQG